MRRTPPRNLEVGRYRFFPAMDALGFVLFLVAWYLLSRVVLPRLGVPT